MQGPLIASRVRVKGHLDFFFFKVFVWAPPIQQRPLQLLLKIVLADRVLCMHK
jgi:hypothetical protein